MLRTPDTRLNRVASRHARTREACFEVAYPRRTHPYWTEVLDRIGVPCAPLAPAGEAQPLGRVLFVPDERALDARDLEQVRDLHSRGAAVVGSEATTARLAGEAPLVALNLPRASELLRGRARMTRLPVGDGTGRAVWESIASVDHGALRRLIEDAIRSACFASGLPFVHLAQHPVGYRPGFCIRVDADGYRESATRATLTALERSGTRATWFLDVERHVRHGGVAIVPELVAARQEVQSHFFHHYTYRSYRKNRRNLRESCAILKAWGIDATAAAAPFGAWNPGVERAVADCGMHYSSEFGRIYGDVPALLPSAVQSRFLAGGPWQVPVHPVCPALLFDAGLDPAGITDYFVRKLEESVARHETAVFYGHPIAGLERCPDLFTALYEALGQSRAEAWKPTMSELWRFHCQRRQQHPSVLTSAHAVSGECHGVAPLCVEVAGQRRQLVTGRFHIPSDPTRARAMQATSVLEWRKATPTTSKKRQLRIELSRIYRELRR